MAQVEKGAGLLPTQRRKDLAVKRQLEAATIAWVVSAPATYAVMLSLENLRRGG